MSVPNSTNSLPSSAVSGGGCPERDHGHMARALQLAELGCCTTHPNPRVGCLVVKEGNVVGQGWHRAAGEAHAEIHALAEAAGAAKGSTLYVNLEPCCHQGRTPPCSQAIIDAGVERVVVAMSDPNPRVHEGGIHQLRTAGIEVVVGTAEQAARKLNRGFIRRMECGTPWTRLKIAASVDGRTAMVNGESQWITSPAAREDAHRLRAQSSAILTGSGTVLQDDPALTARIDGVTRQPLRVVLDSNLSVPPDASIFQQLGEVLVFTTVRDDEMLADLAREEVEIVTLPGPSGSVDLGQVLQELGQREINELMIEAGSVLSGAFLRRDLVDEVVIYLAPDLLGTDARGMFRLPGLENIADKLRFEFGEIRKVGRDIRLTLVKPSTIST